MTIYEKVQLVISKHENTASKAIIDECKHCETLREFVYFYTRNASRCTGADKDFIKELKSTIYILNGVMRI